MTTGIFAASNTCATGNPGKARKINNTQTLASKSAYGYSCKFKKPQSKLVLAKVI